MRLFTAPAVCLLLAFSLMACESYDERLANDAAVTGRVSADEATRASDEYSAQKVREAEADLADRHAFYQGAAGTYEGQLSTSTDPGSRRYLVRLLMAPTLVPHSTSRMRSLEEITSEIAGLSMNVEVQLTETTSDVTIPCVFERRQADIDRGRLTLLSEKCQLVFELALAGDARRETIELIDVSMHSSRQTKTHRFQVKRVNEE